jgi:hypothetical protein
VQAKCENTEANVSVFTGDNNLVLRYLDQKDLRVVRIAGSELFVAIEIIFPKTLPSNF